MLHRPVEMATHTGRLHTVAKMKLKLLLLVAVLQACIVSAQEPTKAEQQKLADDLLRQGVEAYETGRYAEAAAFYRESIQAWGTGLAAANLCNLVLYGQGVEQNYEAALRLCEAAAKMGNANAYVMLGEMYLLGNGVAVDQAKAVEYYRSGAEKGHVHGQFVLGAILANANDSEGVEWLTKATSQGHTGAAELLEQKAAE